MTQLLAGFRVIESSMLLNGASTDMMLRDLGADIIKVESPFGGDPIRAMDGANRQTNKGKRSLAVDLRKPEGFEVFARLLQTADAFVTNAVGDRNRKLGIAYDQLAAIKPDIVYAQNTGFGASGPYAEIPTHGQIMDSLAGALPVCLDGDDLTKPHPRYIRRTGAMASGGEGTAAGAIYAAFHIAAALARRERTGEGCYIDVSSAEAVVASAWIAASMQLNSPERDGWYQDDDNVRPLARYQSYETRDGLFVLFCPEEARFWETFCDLVDRPDLKPRTTGVELRRELQSIFRQRDRTDWMAAAAAHRLPLGPVHETAHQVKADPQITARGLFRELDGFVYVGQPALVDGEGAAPPRPAPSLGEHSFALLRELGYAAAEIERLGKAGVIGLPAPAGSGSAEGGSKPEEAVR